MDLQQNTWDAQIEHRSDPEREDREKGTQLLIHLLFYDTPFCFGFIGTAVAFGSDFFLAEGLG